MMPCNQSANHPEPATFEEAREALAAVRGNARKLVAENRRLKRQLVEARSDLGNALAAIAVFGGSFIGRWVMRRTLRAMIHH